MPGRCGHRPRPLAAIVGLVFVAAALSAATASASASVTHVFDAQLSLTGGTNVSKPQLDSVPDPGPVHPPAGEFGEVCGLAVDSVGDTYVATLGEFDGRIDIFDPDGHFLTEIANQKNPCWLAVDSTGVLYAKKSNVLFRYTPSEYPPTAATSYSLPVQVDSEVSGNPAIDAGNDHVFDTHSSHVVELSSAAEGNLVVSSTLGQGTLFEASGLAVDSSSGKIFVSSVCEGCPAIPKKSGEHVSVIYVFDHSGTLLETIDGSDIPATGGFTSAFGTLVVAVDEQSGEVFVGDAHASPRRVYRFVPAGEGFEWVADPELEDHGYLEPLSIAVSNGSSSPTHGNVYVTSQGPPGHMYAFLRSESGPPVISDSAPANPGITEVELTTEIDPDGRPTRYTIEYVERETYEQDLEELGAGHGFDQASVAAAGELPSGHQPIPLAAAVTGLTPGTAYYFRVVAENCEEGEPEGPDCAADSEPVLFATYPEASPEPECENTAFRLGIQAQLPDCRAYELVTPPDTNGRVPTARSIKGHPPTQTELSTPGGSSLLFLTNGGALPIGDGNGTVDGYEAVRGPAGWSTRATGPAGFQSQAPFTGGASPDHGYWFWSTGSGTDHGSLVIDEETTDYLRLPDGSFQLIGEGPLAIDPQAEGHWISPGGGHFILSSAIPLAPGASPEGTRTIYDRNLKGSLQVVSLLPTNEAPGAGATVSYEGADLGGTTVAFEVTEGGINTLYVRRDGTTVAVATGPLTFAGLSEDGTRLSYLKGGDLFSYATDSATTDPIGSGGQSTVVNVSADGSHVFFVSPAVLTADPDTAAGESNFYVWDAQSTEVSFIAVLENADISGEVFSEGNAYGLGQWLEGIDPLKSGSVGPGSDPSRSTPDGSVLLFESHASLTGYDSGGRSEVYRYAAGEPNPLSCLSCSPALLPAAGDAHLQSLTTADGAAITNGNVPAHNITPDGRTAFFESADALVPQDVDRTTDVYEWHAPGTGGCANSSGCLALISSGHSATPNYLYNVDATGHDVFFGTSDLLLTADQDPTLSIYDARINGGFPSKTEVPCSGEACKGQPLPPPGIVLPGSTAPTGSGNLPAPKKCRKGQRKVHRNGKTRCVARHKRHKHHRQGHSNSLTGGAR